MTERVPHGPYCGCDECSGLVETDHSLEAVTTAVCTAFQVTTNELLSLSREPRLKRARSAVLLLAREFTRISYPKLARLIGRGDHRTAMKGRERALRRQKNDMAFCADLDFARRLIADTRPRGKESCTVAPRQGGSLEEVCHAQSERLSDGRALRVASGPSGSEGADADALPGEGGEVSERSHPIPASDRASAEGASEERLVVRRPRDQAGPHDHMSREFEREAG